MILALLLAATPPPVIAVLEFRDKVPAAERIDTAYLADQVRAAVKEDLPQARLISRENMLILLQSAGRSLEECEAECEVETGRRIGADLVVSGELLRFGSQYKLNMKLHDTRSGELLSGNVAAGTSADELERDLRPAVRKLLAPIFQGQLSDERRAAAETVVAERRLPRTLASFWVIAGYDWTSNQAPLTVPTGSIPLALRSGFGLDLGGDLFFRVAGPLFLGGIIDYSLAGPNALLVAGGARVVVSDLALSGGFGYASVAEGGVGALLAVDLGVITDVTLRLQGSWRRSRFSRDATAPADYQRTVWSLMGGLSLHL